MIAAKSEIVNSGEPVEHLRDRDDPLYWQMRQENDEFLRRQYWWARHYQNGTLKSQRQQELQALAEEAEQLVKKLVEKMGYSSNLTTYKCPFDLRIWDDAGRTIRVEVKISRWNEESRRFQANIRHDKADLLVFIARNGQDWHFVIPMKRIAPRHNIAIWSPCPADYRGQWAKYLEAWEHLRRAIEQAQPQSCQLSLF